MLSADRPDCYSRALASAVPEAPHPPSASDFPMPLAKFIEIDQGRASLSYAGRTGSLLFVVKEARRQLARALSLRGRDKTEALKTALEYLAFEQDEAEMVRDQWSAHLDERRAARIRRRCECCTPAPIEAVPA